jgi:uncharacterized protein CbrC (UPF0167 family)
MSKEVIINCPVCNRELYTGDLANLPEIDDFLCANCKSDEQARAEWEASLEERYLKAQWDRYISSAEELKRAGQL